MRDERAPLDELAAWRRAGRFEEVEGTTLFVREAGEGEALALIHGFPTASWDWHSVWGPLADRWRLVAPDLPGFGFSAKPPDRDYSFLRQADAVESLLVARRLAAVHLLAHDYGDTVVQELLARQIEGRARIRIASACLLNGGVIPEIVRPLVIQRLLASPVGPLVARRIDETRFARAMRRIFGSDRRPDDDTIRALWTLVTANDGLRIAARLGAYHEERARRRDRWVNALSATDVPVRLVVGPADPISGETLAARYEEIVAGADVVRLSAGIGHYPQIEDPEAVVDAYLAFRAGIRGGLLGDRDTDG